MSKGKPGHNNHHKIPRSRKYEGFNIEHEDNQGLIPQRKHDNIHRLFHNATPQEQLLELLEINKSVIQKGVYRQLLQILTAPREDFYKHHLLTWKNPHYKKQ